MRVGIVGTARSLRRAAASCHAWRVREVRAGRSNAQTRQGGRDCIRYGAPASPLIDIWDGDFDELRGGARHGHRLAS